MITTIGSKIVRQRRARRGTVHVTTSTLSASRPRSAARIAFQAALQSIPLRVARNHTRTALITRPIAGRQGTPLPELGRARLTPDVIRLRLTRRRLVIGDELRHRVRRSEVDFADVV